MSYTRLVAYSVVPVLMIFGGLSGGGDGMLLFTAPGAVIEAFILARFFDRRKKTRQADAMPPDVFK